MKWLCLLFLLAVGWLGPRESLAGQTRITVGVALRLNEQYDHHLISYTRGIEIAQSLFSQRNPSFIIGLKTVSHGWDLSSVVDAANSLIQARVPAVLGGEMSEEALVLGERLEAEKIVLMTLAATSPQVTFGRPYVFRTWFSDTEVADRMAHFTTEHLKPAVLGVFHVVSSPYTDYLSRRFTTDVQSSNPKLRVVTVKVLRRTEDLSPVIGRFMKEGVTHVAMFSYDGDLLRFVTQSRGKQYFPVFIGSDGWGSNEFVLSRIASLTPSFEAYRAAYWRDDDATPLGQEFRQEFLARFKERPDGWAAIAFDAAWLLFTAIARAKDPHSGRGIQTELQAIRDLPLVTTERFSLGPGNSSQRDLHVYQITHHGIRYQASLK